MINFLKYRYICFAGSLLTIVAGVFLYFAKGGFRYHIDFVGGTEMTIAFQNPVSIEKLRSATQTKEWEDTTIQSIGTIQDGGFREFVVRFKETEEGAENEFKSDIESEIKDNPLNVRSISRVGAEVGSNIQWNALVALALALLVILLYIALRYELSFAMGAVVATAHDLLAVLVFFLILNEQISLNVLAAVLAVLGYSLNDTIVIFSRIKENFKKLKGMSEVDIVNLSINQTLRRTLLTSFFTLLSVLSLFFLGGETLHSFSLTMIIGIVVGTFSSIYIASPVMLAIRSRGTRGKGAQ